MVRLLPRFSQPRPAPTAPRPRRTLPSPGILRRERRTLLKLREARLRDLGGLLLEMYRQDAFREELIHDRCSELLELDDRLEELGELLSVIRHGPPAPRCACGAPLPLRAHFCANCGRQAGEEPVIACDVCGHALPADAVFCANCGAATRELPLEVEAAAESVDLSPRELAAPGPSVNGADGDGAGAEHGPAEADALER